MEEIRHQEQLFSRFIAPEEALEMATEETLLVVVDTHKPSMVIEERLLNKIDKVVVIDHHRRGEEFIIIHYLFIWNHMHRQLRSL